MEPQETLNNQRILRKRNEDEEYHTPWYLTAFKPIFIKMYDIIIETET